MTWQPIETAPKDGTSILAIFRYNASDPYAGAETHAVLFWSDGGWHDGYWGDEINPVPTHWMPLPEPPAE